MRQVFKGDNYSREETIRGNTVDCFSDLKYFANSWPSASNFKSFSRSPEYFFLTVGQNNFGNKTLFLNLKGRA